MIQLIPECFLDLTRCEGFFFTKKRILHSFACLCGLPSLLLLLNSPVHSFVFLKVPDCLVGHSYSICTCLIDLFCFFSRMMPPFTICHKRMRELVKPGHGTDKLSTVQLLLSPWNVGLCIKLFVIPIPVMEWNVYMYINLGVVLLFFSFFIVYLVKQHFYALEVLFWNFHANKSTLNSILNLRERKQEEVE